MKNILLLLLLCIVSSILCGCFSIPDGDPPKGRIVDIDFSSGPFASDAAKEAMIVKLTNAVLQADLSGKILPVRFKCDAKFKQMSVDVLKTTAPMLNLNTRVARAKEDGPVLVCSQEKLKNGTGWTIACVENSLEIFKIGVNVK